MSVRAFWLILSFAINPNFFHRQTRLKRGGKIGCCSQTEKNIQKNKFWTVILLYLNLLSGVGNWHNPPTFSHPNSKRLCRGNFDKCGVPEKQ